MLLVVGSRYLYLLPAKQGREKVVRSVVKGERGLAALKSMCISCAVEICA